MKQLRWATALVFLVGALLPQMGASASLAGRNGRILFTVVPQGGTSLELFTMNPDGSNRQRLTFNSLLETYPSWSPDGAQIAFSAPVSAGIKDVFVMNADGTSPVNITTSPSEDDETPAWSPDGEWIVMGTERDLWKSRPTGANRTRITDLEGTEYNPAWAPDGTRIAFTHIVQSGDIELLHLSNLNVTKLTDTAGAQNENDPDWSPDGQEIAFTSGSDIWKMNSDGSGQVNLTNTIAGLPFEADPTWSPQGDRIVFTWHDENNLELKSMDSRGGAAIPLTDTSGSDNREPAWESIPYYPCTGWGTSGSDAVVGGGTDDVLCGLEGPDTLYGEGGNDVLYGGTGSDSSWGGHGVDRLVGGKGWDIFRGGTGNDRQIGGPGNDLFYRSDGKDRLEGGGGDDDIDAQDGQPGDVVIGGPGEDTCRRDAGDTVQSCERS